MVHGMGAAASRAEAALRRGARGIIGAGLCVVALAATVTAPSTVRAQTAPPGSMVQGTLFIVGGGPQPAALVREFVTLAGGAGKARVVVFAMASASGRTSGEEKAQQLRSLGAQAVNVWVDRSGADAESVVQQVQGATGIWFGGGDQSRLTAALAGSRTAAAIAERYRAGAVVGGTSAGAAVMSAVMITGDERRRGGVRPDSTLSLGTIARDNIVTADGFGLIDNAVVDQHFLRRRRNNRLISLVLEMRAGVRSPLRGGHWGRAVCACMCCLPGADSTRPPGKRRWLARANPSPGCRLAVAGLEPACTSLSRPVARRMPGRPRSGTKRARAVVSGAFDMGTRPPRGSPGASFPAYRCRIRVVRLLRRT